MTHTTSRLVELGSIEDARYGGKAWGLARLERAGFRVPPAFVLADVDPDDLPAGLRERLDAIPGRVAVRSSATGEDGAAASFAGQYESVLGVSGYDELVAAVRHCVESTASDRAAAYRAEVGVGGGMHVVVQQMVEARAAGVVFTADPASARRDLAVVDAVAGLGESLVSGEACSDHYEVDTAGGIVDRLVSDTPALSDEEVRLVAAGAREAEVRWGHPLDLEWAFDAEGTLHWLQARPITSLPGDLSAMDTEVAGPDHVYTRCNIGEMMPGAYCPLTASVSGRAIEYAMQMVQVVGGFQERYHPDRWLQVGYFSGHMFLNMTEGTALSSGILGNSLEQYSMSICGRVVDELVPLPPKSLPRRLVNTARLSTFALTAGPAVRRMKQRLASTTTPSATEPRALLAELDAAVDLYNEVTLVHVRSSSRAAVPANILEETMVKRAVKAGRSEDDGRSEASALMAGATDAESAVMLQQLDEIVTRLSAVPDDFLAAPPAEAVTALRRGTSPLSRDFAAFLERHGHRGYRELDLRDPSWADDPEGLGTIMQAMVRSKRSGGSAPTAPPPSEEGLPRGVRALARMARAGAAGRETTKSQMVRVAHRLSRGYRLLGEQLAAAGVLPDADLVFFLDRSELPALVEGRDVDALVAAAQSRREALPFQARLDFPDVSVGRPTPIKPAAAPAADGVIVGRPACSGVVEGTVRVATSVAEAQQLERGEILVAPVTDVGWTPYFTLISALVTDIGSSVSHGAVVAREYGLPCVVNTLGASRTLRTGDRVRVDGDHGTVTLLEPTSPATSPATTD